MPVGRLVRRLGRRGTVLLLHGAIWVLIGASLLADPIDLPGRMPHEALPAWVRGVAWIVTGAVGVASAWRPPGRDWLGFASLVSMPLVMSVSFATSAGGWLIGADIGSHRSWIDALIWVAVVAVITVVSGWTEPPNRGGG